MKLNAVRKLGANLFVFGTSKSAVLIAPFLAAWMLSFEQYGKTEWWLSISMALGPLIAFGVNGILAFGTLGGHLSKFLQLASRYIVIVAFVSVCAGLIFFLSGCGEIALIILLSVAVMMQLVIAAKLKAIGRGAWAALAESASYLALLIALLLTLVNLGVQNSLFFSLLVICCLLLLWFIRISPCGQMTLLLGSNFVPLFRESYKFLFSAVLMAFFMAGPRMLIGFFDQSTSVATFSLIFRWLSISIVIHQFINTIYFKKIYSSQGCERAKLIAGSCALVALSALSIAMILSFDLFSSLNFSLPTPPQGNVSSIWFVSIAVSLWSLSACLEGVLNSMGRMGLQIKAASLGCVVFLGGAGSMLLFGSKDTVFVVSVCWMFAFIAIVLTQWLCIVNERNYAHQDGSEHV